MAIIYIDGNKYEVNKADNLLQACLSLNLDIPYFCWHPELGSVGACRQCAIKQYNNADDQIGKLIISCMTPVLDNTFISINDEESKRFRKNIIEFLMINHPHDCPTCEEAGNCHLQDMTVMNNHNVRRYHFKKRTFHNQNLGPFLSHEMNRCITCYRCIRYYKDYADGKDFGVYGTNNNIYFGRMEDGNLENVFSGNLVDICPTGVFTDKTQSLHYNRKWDMQFAPSVCPQCCIGCNISPGERYGKIRRIDNRYHGEINHYFLCDRGRFGYGYVNLKDRPHNPIKVCIGKSIKLSIEQSLIDASEIIQKSNTLLGIGSPRASIESNFALRELVGKEKFSTGITEQEESIINLIIKILNKSGIYTPSLREIESYDAILILGEDITQVAARMALSVRQAIKSKAVDVASLQKIFHWQTAAVLNSGQNQYHPLFITSNDKTDLDDIATWNYYAPIEDQARLGFAIAHVLNSDSPNVNDFDQTLMSKVNIIAKALSNAKKPLIITGSHSINRNIIEAAFNIAKSLKIQGSKVGIIFVTPYPNSLGVSLIGGGISLEKVLSQLSSGEADTVIILENDIYRHFPKFILDTALNNTTNVIVMDHQNTETVKKADIIISVTSFTETDGTLINYEGRAQRFFKVYEPSFYNANIEIIDSWKWLNRLNILLNEQQIIWNTLDDIINSISINLPKLKLIKDAAPNASFRVHGQKLSRSPNRYSGRTAIKSNVNIHELTQPQDKDSMFAFSMEGNNEPSAPRSHIPYAWVPGWNSTQAWNKFQDKVGGSLKYGDSGIKLFNDHQSTDMPWFINIPLFFKKNKTWRLIPYYHLFGSEELSQRSIIFQKRIANPVLIMNSQDATKLNIHTGSVVQFNYLKQIIKLPIYCSEYLSSGQLGVPVGMPGIPMFLVGANVDILKVPK